MSLTHIPEDGDATQLATTVERATSIIDQTVGLMFRRNLPEDYAFCIDFTRPKISGIHSFFVFEPIDVIWVSGDTVVKTKRMNPFRGLGIATADRIIELPAGAASDISPGDTLTISDPQTE